MLHKMANILTSNHPVLCYWGESELVHASYILSEKSTVLSGHLRDLLDLEPLYPPLHHIMKSRNNESLKNTDGDDNRELC